MRELFHALVDFIFDSSTEVQLSALMVMWPFIAVFLLLLNVILMPMAPWRRAKKGLFYFFIAPALFVLLAYLFVKDTQVFKDIVAFYHGLTRGADEMPVAAVTTKNSDSLAVSIIAGAVAFFIFVLCAMFFTNKNKLRNSTVNYLVLLRHGQSQWNLENRFTGFHDIDLSDLGRSEAADAGKRLKALGVKFDAVYTSTLQRAYNTACIALENAGQGGMISQIIRHDDLRERDYGELTGLNKDETRAKYGDEQVHIWRRSYDVCPPGGECLKDVVEKRVRPYYMANIAQQLLDGKNILVAAHGNSLRALLIILGAETPETINAAEMETGVPVVFELEGGKIVKRYALSDKKAA